MPANPLGTALFEPLGCSHACHYRGVGVSLEALAHIASIRIERVSVPKRIVPMLSVADVQATVDWYLSIGFELTNKFEHDGIVNWAYLHFGQGQLMLNAGGKPATDSGRDTSLYIYVGNTDKLHAKIKDRVEVVEDLHDSFYGMREFAIRDINGFRLTFGSET
jgi:uncharacterized glyoxalase superfamily protein PhnB